MEVYKRGSANYNRIYARETKAKAKGASKKLAAQAIKAKALAAHRAHLRRLAHARRMKALRIANAKALAAHRAHL